jgi:hypothetical protein
VVVATADPIHHGVGYETPEARDETQKYLGQEKYPWLQAGEQRVIVTITLEKIDALRID